MSRLCGAGRPASGEIVGWFGMERPPRSPARAPGTAWRSQSYGLNVRSRTQVFRIVPESNSGLRLVVLVSKRAQARGIEQKEPAAACLEAQPASREHAQKMSARKQENIAMQGLHASNDAIGPD